MKKGLLILLLISPFISCVSGNKTSIAGQNFSHFSVSVEQGGIKHDIINHEVSLLREPFSIIFYCNGPDSVFVNASFEPSVFNAAMAHAATADIIRYFETETTEELFNKDELLTISDNSLHYWHYANENEHRFSEAIPEQKALICKRKISRILNTDISDNPIEIEAIDESMMFIVIFKMEWNEDYTRRIEKKREYIKILFTEKNGSTELQGEKPL